MIIYDSKKSEHKHPFGSVSVGTELHFRIFSDVPSMKLEAYLLLRDEDRMKTVIKGTSQPDGITFDFSWIPESPSLYFYAFEITRFGESLDKTAEHMLLVYENDEYEPPKWLREGLMYQIFPDRFACGDYTPPKEQGKKYIMHESWNEEPVSNPNENGKVLNNDFFGGNLRGIIDKLDYFCQLGVTVIYLNPVFRAFSNHRYDTGNYMEIDPMLGTEADFAELCEKALSRGIRVIFDGVFNHTGSDSLYFNKEGSYPSLGAYQSKESPYFSWYNFQKHPDKYDCWWGIETLPAVTENNPSYLDFIARNDDSVLKHWLRCGASGVRLDVADELPDDFLEEIRIAVKSVNPDAAIIGEVWEDASSKIAYGVRKRYFQGKQLDSVMNYPLKDAIISYIGNDKNAESFAEKISALHENYPAHIFNSLMNILGTHDTERIFSIFQNNSGSYEKARQKLYQALLLWAFLPGIPCLYYGDELGMLGGKDPMNRRTFCDENANNEVKDYYRKVLSFRKRIPDISQLSFKPCKASGGYYSFTRQKDGNGLLVSINAGSTEVVLDLRDKGCFIADFLICGSVWMDEPGLFRLASDSGIVFRLNNM